MPIALQALLHLAKTSRAPFAFRHQKDNGKQVRDTKHHGGAGRRRVYSPPRGRGNHGVVYEPSPQLHASVELPKSPKVIKAVRQYRPAHLYVSLDGNKVAYKAMRGCNGHDKVIEVVEALKDEVPISLMFCLSPWNSFADMDYVIGVAKRYGIDVRIGIYGTMDFFDTTAELLTADMENYIQHIPQSIHDTEENFDFVALYEEWRNGNLKLRCQSIFSELVIHSNGDVPLCQNLDVKLGNIHTCSLDDIFNSRNTCKIQCKHSKECNGCWINFHRKYDLILLRNFEKLLPKRLIELFYGKYQWTSDKKETYQQYFKRIADR